MKPSVFRHKQLPLQKLGEGVHLKILADSVTGAKNLAMGWIRFRPASKSSMHSRDVEEFIYVIKGEATVMLESGEEYKLRAGDMIHIPPGVTHQHQNNTDSDAEQIYIFAPQGPEKSLRDLPITEDDSI